MESDQYPAELTCLIALSELSHLNHAVRERLKKERREHIADYRRLSKDMGHEPSLDGEISYLRRREAEERTLLRQNRRNIFAIGYSTFERFLDMRLRPLMPNTFNRKGSPKILGLKHFFEFLQKCSGKSKYFSSAQFKQDCKRCDLYRIARNKITHQAGYIDPQTGDSEEEELLAQIGDRLFGVMLCDSDYLQGMKEIHIEGIHLGDVLTFFENFALRIDSELRSLEES